MLRRASTPCLSFSTSAGSSSMADRTDAAMPRRNSFAYLGTPLRLPPLRSSSPKAKKEHATESIEVIEIAQEAKQSQQPGTVSKGIVVEDEQTALARCLQEEVQAKKLLISATSGGDPSELAEAIAYARSAGLDSNKLASAEATLKQLKAAKVRKQLQECRVVAPLNSKVPEDPEPWSISHQRDVTCISPEAQAVLAGMMEAQTIVSQAWAAPDKIPPPVMRRRRASTSMMMEAQTIISQAWAVPDKIPPPAMRRRRASTSMTNLRAL